MRRSLEARLAALEGEGDFAPVIVFPDRAVDPAAFCTGGVRVERGEGESVDEAVRRTAARVRPGAQAVLWPLPVTPLDGAR
jgi:hypothetical protein